MNACELRKVLNFYNFQKKTDILMKRTDPVGNKFLLICSLVSLPFMTSPFYKSNTITRSGVRTHADIRPLDLKSNALITRPSWCSCSAPALFASAAVLVTFSFPFEKYFKFNLQTTFSLCFFHMFLLLLEAEILVFNFIFP